MAYKAAKGNAPATGMQKTPAPTRPAPPDAVDTVRNPSAQSYGENGPANNASRTNPGEFVESDLGKNMRASVDDDGVLDRIIRDGTAKQDDSVTGQLRTIAAGNVPTHPAMKGAAPGPKIPAMLGAAESLDPVDPYAKS